MRAACLFVLLVLAGAAAAQDRVLKAAVATPGQDRVALIIGNSAYKDAPLANPVNDAADVAQALRDLGFKVHLRRNASQREMRQAIREFAGDLRRANVGLFYFAGHGIQIRGNNFLVPVGADIQSEAEAEDFSVDVNLVLRTMAEAQVKFSIAILDACRNNPFARSFRSASRGLAQVSAASGALVAYATAPDSVAADGTGRNGIYTKHLLRHMRAPDVPVEIVFKRVREDVEKETASKQVPWESSSLKGDFFFATRGASTPAVVHSGPAPTPASVAIQRDFAAEEDTFWESIKGSTNPAEYRAYLKQYPKGRFVRIARARIEAYTATIAPATKPAAVSASGPAPAASVKNGMTGATALQRAKSCKIVWHCNGESLCETLRDAPGGWEYPDFATCTADLPTARSPYWSASCDCP